MLRLRAGIKWYSQKESITEGENFQKELGDRFPEFCGFSQKQRRKNFGKK